jgi:2-polyprenyl-3-methyl-5-hydroxy-6-metoxy-1,4-benzoquinol methylase
MICRLCQRSGLVLYYTQGDKNQFKFYKCLNCKLVNYDLSGGINQEKYADLYVDPLDGDDKKDRGQTQIWHFIRKYIHKTGKLLDIGCGNGRLLNLAKEKGFQVKGIEMSPYLAEVVSNKLGIEIITTDFLRHQALNERFDVVVLRHVLEHLPDPVMALSKIYSLLNEGGYAVLEFPNIESFDLKWKRRMSKYGFYKRRYKPDYLPGHCNEFSRKSFEYLTNLTGFKIIIWQSYSYKKITNFFYNRIKIRNKVRTIIRKNNEGGIFAG